MLEKLTISFEKRNYSEKNRFYPLSIEKIVVILQREKKIIVII